MNYAEELKNRIFSETVSTPVRAVIYARVSTENDGQKESCANQVALAERFISEHPNMTLVESFIDDGISGKNDFTRPAYNAMLSLLVTDGFDIIVTKSLSRLNRDSLTSLNLSRQLVEMNATILTLEDNQVHDFEDMTSDLVHAIKYAFDEQYVKNQSMQGRKTHELRCQRKELSAKDISYGYIWDTQEKCIRINRDEAKIVNYIFEEFVYRNGYPSSIQNVLEAKGINITYKTIGKILKNERYVGRFYINTKTTKLGLGRTKSRRIPLPKDQWILIERPDLRIVDDDLFKMAQRIRSNRNNCYSHHDKDVARAYFAGLHLFSSKIFCEDCGKPYVFGYADRKKEKPLYRIYNHSKCSNPYNRIYEKDLVEILEKSLQSIFETQDAVCSHLEAVLTECIKASKNNLPDTSNLKKQISTREKQINELITTLSEGGLTEASKNRIKSKINDTEEEIANLAKTIENTEKAKKKEPNINEKIAQIRLAISELRKFTTIDRNRVQNYVEKIIVKSSGDIDILLKTGATVSLNYAENYLKKPVESVAKTGTLDAR